MLKDKDIREPLFEFLEDKCGRVRIIEEKQIGRSRADVMMVLPDAIIGIEIKSDADTFARLERQVKDYNRFFDYNIAAVGTSHAEHISEHIPGWWGIITIEDDPDFGRPDFYFYRKPQSNPKREKKIKLRNQLSFLWRPELVRLQEINGMPMYRENSKKFVIEKIMERVDPDLLKRQICSQLFERDYNTINEEIAEYRKKTQTK